MIFKNTFFRPLILCLFLLFLNCGEKEDKKADPDQQQDLRALAQELERQQERNDSLVTLLQKSTLATEYPVYYSRDFDTINDPETFITEALREHKELIPKEAVLGGTMQFQRIDVITEDWVLATYEDGHVQGKAIYQYKLLPNGKLKFVEVVSTLQE